MHSCVLDLKSNDTILMLVTVFSPFIFPVKWLVFFILLFGVFIVYAYLTKLSVSILCTDDDTLINEMQQ
jgi:hypothetical protein